ncbi:MAG: hypothetical protein K8T90_00235 [Planctomycetes bacterium]|nr:hypothetical protein [Planctomycetota bacterium]
MPHVPGSNDDQPSLARDPGASAAVWAAAVGAVVFCGAQSALAGDVSVERQGKKIVVLGTSAADDVLIEPGANAGEIKVTGQFGSTVNGGASATIAIAKKDTLVVQLGTGTNSTEVSGVLPPFATFLGLGGTGNDRWTFSNTTLPGSAKFQEAGGDNFWSVNSSKITKTFIIAGGDGVDTLVSSSSEFGGTLAAKFGPGAYNGASLYNCTLHASVALRGDTGDDNFQLYQTTLDKNLLIDGGAGADELRLDESTVKGGTKLLARDGDDTVRVSGCTLKGAAAVDLGVGDDSLQFFLTQAAKVAMKLGDGNDAGQMGDLHLSSKFVLLGGSGDDTVRFNDTLGSQSAKDVLLDGGTGANQRAGSPTLTGGGMLVEKNFPK